MNLINMEYLEVIVNRTCNLKCIGCTSFCDYPHGETSDWESVKNDLLKWSQILKIHNIGLLGGEPLANPKFYDWLVGVRSILKDTFILLVTNGTLLDKWPDLLDKMIENSPGKIMITLHTEDERILSVLEKMVAGSKYRFIVKNYQGEFFERQYVLLDKQKKFSIQVIEPDYFIKLYKGYGKNIYPYNTEDYVEAHNLCIDSPMLFNGRIYRCSKFALLKEQLELTGQLYDEENIKPWNTYLEYEGVSYNLDFEKIREELGKFDKAEEVCKSCPGNMDNYKIINNQNILPKYKMIRITKK